MEVAQIKVTKFQAKVVRRDPIPAGLVGGTISVSFDDSWNGLQITAVFEGAVTKDVLNVKDVIAIPPEVIAKPGRRFKVGFYGTSLDGKIVIPTMYADMGLTEVAADPSGDTSTNPTLPVWEQLDIRTSNLEDELQEIKENGIPGGGTNVDLTGYATEEWVQKGYQPKGNYLSEVPAGYAKYEDIPKKPSDIGAQPAGDYALVSQIPSVPVKSVNGKTGAVQLSAADVGARPSNWMPTAQDVGALPATYTPPNQTAEQVGADPKGTAASAVSQHNTADDSHNDIRLELKAINDRLTAFFDSDNQTLDELSEIVAYITSNKTLIDSITTSKVSVTDIINNLTTNVSNKPLSAAQGVVLKGLIDTLSGNLANYQPKGDYALRSELPTVPTKVSAFENDKGYLTQHQDISHKLDASALPTAINTALEQAKKSGEFNPVKGEDYWTDADQEAIVQQVIAALGTPVFGTVDTDKKITLSTDNLVDGTYELGYEDVNGNWVKICDYIKDSEPKPSYTNILDVYPVELNKRWSGSSAAYKDCVGMITFTLPWSELKNKTLRLKGFPGDIQASSQTTSFYWLDSQNATLDMDFWKKPDGSNLYRPNIWLSNGTTDENGVYSYEFIDININGHANANAVNVRISLPIKESESVTEADLQNLVITINEPIVDEEPSYTNILDNVEILLNKRWSRSGAAYQDCTGMITFTLPWIDLIDKTLRLKGFPGNIQASSKDAVLTWVNSQNTAIDTSFRKKADGSNYYAWNIWLSNGTYEDGGVYAYEFTSTYINGYSNANAETNVVISLPIKADAAVTEADLQNLVITINEPIV